MPYRRTLLVAVMALIALLCGCDRGVSADTRGAQSAEDAGLEELERGARTVRLTGDLDAILDRGYIRILVPYSKTFYFHEGARPRGLAVEFMEEFAKAHRTVRAGKPAKLTVVFLPMPRDRLIPGIAEGLGDVAIAGLTATAERSRVVDFITHSSQRVSEVVVTGPEAPQLSSIEDLSGQRVFVRESSSYHESLVVLNKRLRAAGKKPIKIVPADENLESEDILELVKAGIESITVADDYLAGFWSELMGGLTVRDDLVIREAAPFGPVIRKNSPQLAAALRQFEKTHGVGTSFGNVVTKRYLQENRWVRNPNASADRKRFEKTLPLFQKYAERYDFDTLLLAAQGYQESELDQSVRSPAGAVGVMQIKPGTAAAEPIGIPDVAKSLDSNIHAGTKYLRHMVDDYFNEPAITPFNRHVFAIAAYNAGPSRVKSLRDEAARQGLDPNVWFNNVELVAARAVGRENVNYVRNVLKYWVAYRLAADRLLEDASQ